MIASFRPILEVDSSRSRSRSLPMIRATVIGIENHRQASDVTIPTTVPVLVEPSSMPNLSA